MKKVSNEEFRFVQTSNQINLNHHEVKKKLNLLNNELDSLNNDLEKSSKIWSTETPLPSCGDKNILTMRNFDIGGQNKNSSKWLRFFGSRRGLKRTTILVLVGAICFLVGVALPFMICKIGKSNSASKVEPEGLRSRPLPLKADQSLSELQNVLNSVMITVKTTHKYHYPRVVILLETWVSLVRSQVRNFFLWILVLASTLKLNKLNEKN